MTCRDPSFDPVLETISALAASAATDPWLMTAGLALTGAAHVGAALALGPLPGAGLPPAVAWGTSAVLTGLVLVFVAELQGVAPDGGAATGLAERAAAGAQALTPALVLGVLGWRGRSRARGLRDSL